nr:hypothetical protein BaRGS_012007 [Batillaria attramentaria]
MRGRGQDPVIQCWLEVEAEAGRVEWTHPRDVCCCWISTHWHIKVKDENYGIVLDAFEFRLKPGGEYGFDDYGEYGVRNAEALERFYRRQMAGMNNSEIQTTTGDKPGVMADPEDTELTECSAPEDELSSCSDLLRSDFFRVFLWGQSALAISGNAGVIVYRLFVEKKGTSVAFLTMVINLAVSDFLMGVYLAVIGAADTHYSGVTLASVPLFERDWQFYAQTGICLPLPINRGYSDGQRYSFGVFVVLNFVLCLVIGAGQSFTYISIRRTSQATKQGSQQHEVTIARRLVLVVLTDFVCWLPIGLLGLMASQGSPIPGVVNVWAAIFVLPLNSALNPFLYTISTLRQRWARDKMKTQIERMMGKLHVQIRTWPRDKVEELVNFCIRTQLVERSHVLKLAGVTEVDLAATDLKPRHVCPTVKDLAMLPHDQVEDLIFSLQEAGVLHLDRVLERADFKTPSTTTTTTLHPPPTDDDKMHAESTHTQADRESRDVEVNGRNATAPQAEMVDIFSTQAEVHHVHDIGHENKTLAG